jgi:hypothetical protein
MESIVELWQMTSLTEGEPLTPLFLIKRDVFSEIKKLCEEELKSGNNVIITDLDGNKIIV